VKNATHFKIYRGFGRQVAAPTKSLVIANIIANGYFRYARGRIPYKEQTLAYKGGGSPPL